ncbi:MAG: hypothetical protein HRU78_08015 [Gammaproteobacteria bacterium]|nr:MAG: hypothetical protein HRU78_08015 [Gammaproteobacteria bacterium]
MTTVFISGSMQIKNLDTNVRMRIDNIISSGFDVIVGDADGVDASIQSYLCERQFNRVVVYCSGQKPRNNIGDWRIQKVCSSYTPGTRAFFTAKDLEMATKADYGLMIWDTKSTGTLSNILELLAKDKKSLVYVNRVKKFLTVSEIDHLKSLFFEMSDVARMKAEQKIGIANRINAMKYKQGSLLV